MQETTMERKSEKRYFTYRDAETYTGLSRWTLLRAVDRGDLHKITVGATVRFDRDDLDAFMQARRS